MAEDEDDSRESGIEFGDLEAELEGYDYPATASEISEAYGDEKIGLPDGDKELSEVLAPFVEGENEETFESAEEVHDAIFNLVGSDAVGRDRYSDRGDDYDESEGSQESF